jgi:hypothetical protein
MFSYLEVMRDVNLKIFVLNFAGKLGSGSTHLGWDHINLMPETVKFT